MDKTKYLKKLAESGIKVGLLPKKDFHVEIGDTLNLDISELPIGGIVTVVRVTEREIIVYGAH